MKWLDKIINFLRGINLKEIIDFSKNHWIILIIILIISIIIIRIKIRGYFWEDRYGNLLTLSEFLGRWRKGVEGITPVQQTLTSLWGYPLILGGMITGIVINIIHKQWWLLLILVGGLPITLMSVVSMWQKYKSQKKAQDAYEEAMSQMEDQEQIGLGEQNE